MDIKTESEIKEELSENEEHNRIEQTSGLEYIEKGNCFININVKSEISVKDEPFTIEEEGASNDHLYQQVYGPDNSQNEHLQYVKI
ncbi:hypothetical protein Avbf_16963 [Armadillidium vulgare]|nr:hypothetical protein Avbf_16963 [Armadillidium vulgare]